MDWMNIPLNEFHGVGNPTTGRWDHPHGQNVSTEIMRSIDAEIARAFGRYLPDDDETIDRYEIDGLVPVLRGGQWQDEDVEYMHQGPKLAEELPRTPLLGDPLKSMQRPA